MKRRCPKCSGDTLEWIGSSYFACSAQNCGIVLDKVFSGSDFISIWDTYRGSDGLFYEDVHGGNGLTPCVARDDEDREYRVREADLMRQNGVPEDIVCLFLEQLNAIT